MKIRSLILTPIAALALAPMAHAQNGGTMARVKEAGELRIGVVSAEPWFYKDPTSEQWAGIGVAMGERMADDLGVALFPVETSWANAVAGLQANQFDIMFVLDAIEARKRALAFPENPLFYYAMGALVKEGSEAKTWDELDTPETRIGVTLGTSLDLSVTEMMTQAQISRFSSNDEATDAFAAGRIDAVVQFHPALVVQYSRLRMGKVLLPEPVDPVATSAGMRQEDSTEFLDWVNTTFADLYAAGVPDELFGAYLASKDIDPNGIPGLLKEDW
ncbi:transporter substrate-binding domain-containing protein [Alloyangia pacifica]|uniref:Polar amino acid transport system substrate-binding protein n=1 Tax=Alloyangia pacifica TaxID=311180 RepID=A0A1I6QEZ6_9RHOB|nr:transporter substrate-binding domain-containing protein [Alloyangia pacifica]SDF88335.1 polar amino acid transport system substrate-binding protein [Alloyangia pacifica]SFS51046.1 polar amino acid transport system substrate-binding protein [Alloyangia pacifica]